MPVSTTSLVTVRAGIVFVPDAQAYNTQYISLQMQDEPDQDSQNEKFATWEAQALKAVAPNSSCSEQSVFSLELKKEQ
jgi:hypothetical protein